MRIRRPSKPSVFVIESLTAEDENEDRYEGRFLRTFLKLSGKSVDYIYIRTLQELEYALRLFKKSSMRYLHISCHGGRDGIALTLEDHISIDQFAELVAPYLDKRRLFLSACDVTSLPLAKSIFARQPGCHSIVGFGDSPDIRDAALMWTTFYHKTFKLDPDAMSRDRINRTLEPLANLFEIKVRHYFPKPTGKVTRTTFAPGAKPDDKEFPL